MSASWARTSAGSITSTASPQPARWRAMRQLVGAADQHLHLVAAGRGVAAAGTSTTRWTVRTGRAAPGRRSDSCGAGPARPPACPPPRRRRRCHVSARSKPGGRSTGSPVTSTARTRFTRNVRRPVSVPATRYHVAPFSTSPSGWTARSVSAQRAVGVSQANLAGRRRRRAAAASRCCGGRGAPRAPHDAGSSTIGRGGAPRRRRGTSRAAPAPACAAPPWPSGVAVDDGPATRNSVRASSAVSPLRSVRAPPISDHPPPLAGLGVDGDAGDRQRLEVAAGRLHRDLQLVGELGGGDAAASPAARAGWRRGDRRAWRECGTGTGQRHGQPSADSAWPMP